MKGREGLEVTGQVSREKKGDSIYTKTYLPIPPFWNENGNRIVGM